MKTSELQGAALDWAVAKCEGKEAARVRGLGVAVRLFKTVGYDPKPWQPSTDWSQGGPIIEREKIDLFTEKQTYPESWCASIARYQNGQRRVGWRLHQYGTTPLIAAMRCFVASNLGDEVEVPEELTA